MVGVIEPCYYSHVHFLKLLISFVYLSVRVSMGSLFTNSGLGNSCRFAVRMYIVKSPYRVVVAGVEIQAVLSEFLHNFLVHACG